MPPAMNPTSSTPTEQPPQEDEEGVSAGALFTWLTHLKAVEGAEDEPSRYASPPCYLAEFSAEDSADHSAES